MIPIPDTFAQLLFQLSFLGGFCGILAYNVITAVVPFLFGLFTKGRK